MKESLLQLVDRVRAGRIIVVAAMREPKLDEAISMGEERIMAAISLLTHDTDGLAAIIRSAHVDRTKEVDELLEISLIIVDALSLLDIDRDDASIT